jgi:hypothetical protein
MRKLLLLIPLFLLAGCGSEQTPEEKEAAKYPPPKMMSEEEGKKFMEGQRDPRNSGPVPKTGP